MKEYAFSLVCVSVMAALFTLLCPSDAATQKYFRFTVGLTVICALFLPLGNAKEIINGDYIAKIEEFFGSQEDSGNTSYFAESFEKYGSDYVNAQIVKDVVEKFDIDISNCRAVSSFSYRDGGVCFEKITLIISGKAIWKDSHAIEDYIRDTYMCEGVVAIE